MYESPHQQLVRLLADSKREGLPFREAWDRAMRPGQRMVLTNTRPAPEDCVRWPTDSGERAEWQTALRDLRAAFRRAYQGRPMTVRERSAMQLAALLSGGDELAGVRGIRSAPSVRSVA